MDAENRTELNVAIVAHCEWLKLRGVRFLDPRDETKDLPPDLVSESIVGQTFASTLPEAPVASVLATLRLLCSLRTRVGLSDERARALREATKRLEEGNFSTEEKKRQIAMISFGLDEVHLRELEPSLKEAERRLGIAGGKLEKYARRLAARHEQAAKLGFASISTADMAIATWVRLQTEALETDYAFLRRQMQGQQLAEHAEPVDSNKVWRRAMNSALEALKEAGLPSRERRLLFPGNFKTSADPDEQNRQRGREYKSRKRSKTISKT